MKVAVKTPKVDKPRSIRDASELEGDDRGKLFIDPAGDVYIIASHPSGSGFFPFWFDKTFGMSLRSGSATWPLTEAPSGTSITLTQS